MQLFDITVQSAGNFTVHAAGRYIKYLSGNNGGGDTRLLITPGGMGGAKITLVPGQAYRIAKDAPMPDSWTLANYAGGAVILGQVVIGNGQIDDNSIAGTVQVVDGGKFRTLANNAFGCPGNGAPGAGVYSRVQLWNPVTNTNRLVVESVSLYMTAAGSVLMADSTVQLANLYQFGQPKKLGGVASVAGTYSDTNAAMPTGMFAEPVISGQQQVVKLNEPVIVPPGHGLMCVGNVVNTFVQVNFEWYEEPNV